MATVRFNNAMYELNRTITAGANNAMAFIGHDRDAAVQRALANAAVASAQADAAARAAGDVGRNATIGPYSGSFNEWMVEMPENFFHAKSIMDIALWI